METRSVSLRLILNSNGVEKDCYPELMSRQIAFAQTAMGQCSIHKYRENHSVDCPQKVFCAAHELFEEEELDTPSFARVGGSQLDEIYTMLGSCFGPSSTSFTVSAMLLASKNEGDVL